MQHFDMWLFTIDWHCRCTEVKRQRLKFRNKFGREIFNVTYLRYDIKRDPVIAGFSYKHAYIVILCSFTPHV